MNYRSFFGLALLLCATGCSSATEQPPALSQSPTIKIEATQSPNQSPAQSPNQLSTQLPKAAPRTAVLPSGQTPRSITAPPKYQIDPSAPVPVKPDTNAGVDKGGSGIERDYGSTTPISTTGKMTVRDQIRSVDIDKLITLCPTDSAPYALAESTHYRVQICSEEYDPKLPKYYIGQAKDGSGELRITSRNLDEARQLVFKNDDYTYVLYRDGARPDQSNAYLEVYTPNGESYAEALFYLYE